jgi:hypothetical protein
MIETAGCPPLENTSETWRNLEGTISVKRLLNSKEREEKSGISSVNRETG